MLDITKGIQSLTTFRRRSGDFMKQLKRTRRPVVLTVKGKPAAIVQDAEAYRRLLDMLQGKVRPAMEVLKDLEARHGIIRRPRRSR